MVALLNDRFGLTVRVEELERAGSSLQLDPGSGPKDWIDAALALDEAVLQALIDAITVRETHFFRTLEQFELVRSHLRSQRPASSGRGISAWSAGCASGEEAYSLAAALLSIADEVAPGLPVSVVGVDLSHLALARAVAGRYEAWSLRGDIPDWARSDIRRDGRAPVISERVRAVTRFEFMNLADPSIPASVSAHAPFDVVFCRNVLMYLDPDRAAAVVRRLTDLLAPGGLLVLSPADMPALPSELSPVPDDPAALVKRTSAARRPMPARPSEPASRSAPSVPANRAREWAAPSAPALGPAPAPTPDPGPEPLLQTLKQLADSGDLARARTACAHVLRRYPNHPTALLLSGLLELEGGEVDSALGFIQRALRVEPHFALARFALATALQRSGRPADARTQLRSLRQLLSSIADDEVLPGPEPVRCAWLKTIVDAQLRDGGA